MKGVIFDLDGVLIDSRENMSYAWSMVKHHCKIDIPFEKYFNEIGKPFEDILHAIGVPEANYEQVEKIYNSYANDSCDKINIYDGVKDFHNYHSTVTDLAKFLGLSISKPFLSAE